MTARVRAAQIEWSAGAAGPALHAAAGDERPEPWRDRALCAEVGGDLWFIDLGGNTRPAKAVCAACPVAESCLEYALDFEAAHETPRWGVWGGLSPRQRAAVARERREPVQVDAA